jgi:hypothetical protein
LGTLNLTDPVNGTTADASLIADNNTAIKAVVNGGIDNTNIASGADIDVSKIEASYSAYTPTLGGITIGNGTAAARYVQVGKLVVVEVAFTAGSTTSFSGTITFSLPVTAASGESASTPLGTARGTHGSSSAVGAVLEGSSTVRFVYASTWPTGTEAQWAATAPWTWGSGDTINFTAAYEAA